MGSIVTYLQNEQRTFDEFPFNEVDSLVLSSVCYFNFECAKVSLTVENDGKETTHSLDLVPWGNDAVLLHDILCLANIDELISNSWLYFSPESKDFVLALTASRRYRDISCTCYKNEVADAIEKQFAAINFTHVGKHSFNYVAYRGTDGTFSGWKEDFNLSYKSIIPSQRNALFYLSGIALLNDYPIIVGGHSKGGNLATFAALCCEEALFERIALVFNHDGPSFLTSPSPRKDSKSFNEKYFKTVPESSIIGMILQKDDHYTVVKSTSHSVFQHNPFSWIVEKHNFVKQEEINPSAQFFDAAVAEWINAETDEEREKFIDALYAVLISSGHSKFSEFQQNMPANVATIVKNGMLIDKQTRKFIFKVIGDFASIIKDESLSRLAEASPLTKITNGNSSDSSKNNNN